MDPRWVSLLASMGEISPEVEGALIAEAVLSQEAVGDGKAGQSHSWVEGEGYVGSGLSLEDSATLRDWTGNQGSTGLDSELYGRVLKLVEEAEPVPPRTLYRAIDVRVDSPEELAAWVEENYPLGEERSLSTGSGPVSTTTDSGFALRGVGLTSARVVFRLVTGSGLVHPHQAYESEVILSPASYRVVGHRVLADGVVLVDVEASSD